MKKNVYTDSKRQYKEYIEENCYPSINYEPRFDGRPFLDLPQTLLLTRWDLATGVLNMNILPILIFALVIWSCTSFMLV